MSFRKILRKHKPATNEQTLDKKGTLCVEVGNEQEKSLQNMNLNEFLFCCLIFLLNRKFLLPSSCFTTIC